MRVGGARPPPLITFTLTSKVAVYAPAEGADTLTLFHLYQYMYSVVSSDRHQLRKVRLEPPPPPPCLSAVSLLIVQRDFFLGLYQ